MYRKEPLFPYADGYFGIFPKSFANKNIGNGSIVVEDDYIVYFKPDTPEEIKQRFIKDYAEHCRKQKESGIY